MEREPMDEPTDAHMDAPMDTIEELLPGYALNALDSDDRVRVERALEREPRYQAVLRDYLEGAAALARGFESVALPASLSARPVLRGIEAPASLIWQASRVLVLLA